MFLYNDYSNSATIYSHTNQGEWSKLCEMLNTESSLEEVYFHYVSYFEHEYFRQYDLRAALQKAVNLKSVLLKGSSFSFSDSVSPEGYKGCGLEWMLDELASCKNLEHIKIRNYTSDELNLAFESLVNLIESNFGFKKLTIWHQEIDCANFRLLCDLLAKPRIAIELDLAFNVTLSPENKILLKRALQSNPNIKVIGPLSNLREEEIESLQEDVSPILDSSSKEKDTFFLDNVYTPVLSGFITALGVVEVALALVLLNAATFGIPGLVVAGMGVAAILTGVGMFGANHVLNKQHTPDFLVTMQNAY